jgi:flagellar biosynthesis/type III secretory pathway protein FliH
MQYVRKRMAEMDYYNGIRTAKERGFKKGEEIGKKKAEIKILLRSYEMGIPVEMIAQVVHKTVDEVINIIDNEQLRRYEKVD